MLKLLSLKGMTNSEQHVNIKNKYYRHMKLNNTIIFGICILLGFSQCKNTKELAYSLEADSSFKIEKAVYREWIGGVKGARGTTIEIVIDNQNITVDSLYFRNHPIVAELNKLEDNKLQIIGNISKGSTPDIIMHIDPKKEYANKAPEILAKFPFELTSDELVMRYMENNKTSYLKIKLIKQKTQFYQ